MFVLVFNAAEVLEVCPTLDLHNKTTNDEIFRPTRMSILHPIAKLRSMLPIA